MYVYVCFDDFPEKFHVGFFDPTGEWHEESVLESKEDAAARISYLNGGKNEAKAEKLKKKNEGMLKKIFTAIALIIMQKDMNDMESKTDSNEN